MNKYVVGVTQNGCELYINVVASSAGRYFSRQPHLVHVVKDILEPMSPEGAEVSVAYDTGRKLGNTNIVATNENDAIYYAKPLRKTITYRFVKNRSLTPSSELAILLRRDSDNNYEIIDVWLGPLCPPFPGAEDATAESHNFWESHALVADSEPIQPQTITRMCPY